MIFDSWAGVLPRLEYERWSQDPITRLVAGLRRRHPACEDHRLSARIGGAVAAGRRDRCHGARPRHGRRSAYWANRMLPQGFPVQGNLDPMALIAGGPALDAAVDDIRGALAGRPHIFNLGHGITPETPIAPRRAARRAPAGLSSTVIRRFGHSPPDEALRVRRLKAKVRRHRCPLERTPPSRNG